MPVLRTLAAPAHHEIAKIKGSRFMATGRPVSTEDEAMAFVEACREAEPEATHHTFAWRLGLDPNRFRFSDDGEPSGTAGRPILRAIDGRELSDLVVVVIRWYGGTKLGTGGLVRAYGAAAAALLDEARIVERVLTETLRLRFPYDLLGVVRGALVALGLEESSGEYGGDVVLELAVPLEDVVDVRTALVEATAGRIELEGGGA